MAMNKLIKFNYAIRIYVIFSMLQIFLKEQMQLKRSNR
jgi:hypothetical protein